jgi:hypothetical protein
MPAAAAGSGIVDGLFDLCVRFLLWLADLFGVSYQAINIWIFCVLWPVLTVALIVVVIRQRRKIRELKRESEEQVPEEPRKQTE